MRHERERQLRRLIAFRDDNLRRADLAQHFSDRFVFRLGDNNRNAELLACERRHDGCFRAITDTDNGGLTVTDSDLREDIFLRDVGANGVRDIVESLLIISSCSSIAMTSTPTCVK